MLAILASFSAIDILTQLSGGFLAWGWIIFLLLAMWVAWETYLFLKRVDYTSSMQWTFLQVTVPEDSAQTPKAFENAIEVWGGIHKDPDITEKYFDGYMLPWYSCEIQCTRDRVRYIMVVPTAHAKFFEGVIYGQYPSASVKEVEDYTQEFSYQDLEKTFDLYGTEIVAVSEEIYPIRTYREYEDTLAEDDKFIDPHAALIEAYSNIGEGEQFWVQFLIKPVDASVIDKWAKTGFSKIQEITSGKEEKPKGLWSQILSVIFALPLEALSAALGATGEAEKKKEQKARMVINPAEDAVMRGIMQKCARAGYKTKIRLVYISPAGRLNKPTISKAIGAFKQFNTFNLNSLKPDAATKTNGPNYILKQTRRRYRKKHVLLDYQWRDFWGDTSGQMFSADELATLYHFPIKYVKSPVIQRATSGLGGPPENLPYV